MCIETLGKRDLFIRFPEPLSDTLVAKDIVEITFSVASDWPSIVETMHHMTHG